MIEAIITVTEDEFAEAQKLWCSTEARKLPGHYLLIAIFLIIGGLIGGSLHYLPLKLGASLYGMIIVWWLVSRWRKRAVIKHQHRLRSDIRRDVHLHVDDLGYRDEKPGRCGGWISWQDFTGWRETARTFVLGRDLTFVVIPKASLTAEQQDEFRDLARAHLDSR